MGRRPCCEKEGLNRGAWTAMEDKTLTDYINLHGEGQWRNLPKRAGLKRCGKSCRLRWLNYLRPDIKRGNISPDEEDLIIRLHKLLGNRWSLIAGRLPGRTDNEIKNYWNTNIGKRVQSSAEDHPISSNNPNRKSKEKSNRATKQHPVPNIEPASLVVRTKATRCTRVFLSSEPQNSEKTHHHKIDCYKPVQLVGPSSGRGHHQEDFSTGEVASHTVTVSNDIIPTSPYISMENNLSDFGMDFDLDDKFFSDFLLNEDMNDDDFALLYGDHAGVVKGNTGTSSSNSEQTVFFPNEMLEESDLQSMAPLVDYNLDWL